MAEFVSVLARDDSTTGETHLPWLKVHVSRCATTTIPYPEVIKSVPHMAFEVDDLSRALEGKNILFEPNSPSPGLMVAMIIDGAPN